MADPSRIGLGRPVIFLGPPGAGKGTQARQIAKLYGVPHISTGDMIREHMARGTELGRKAKPFMDAGDLVPDGVVLDLVKERIGRADCSEGFVLDGFPRTLAQAEQFDGILCKDGFAQPLIVHFVVDERQLLRRLTGRRTCSVGGEIYNIYEHPPKDGERCDNDGGQLIQRPDDREEVIRERLSAYNQSTSPLVEYYGRRGLLAEIDGSAPPPVVTERLTRLIERPAGSAVL